MPRRDARKDSPEFGAFVAERRSALGLSLKEMARLITAGGIRASSQYVHDMETGLAPYPKKLAGIAKTLGENVVEWLKAAGYEDYLGPGLGEPVPGADSTIDTGVPKVGSMSDSIMEYDAGHAPDQGEQMRYAVVVTSGWSGGVFQKGDVLLFEQVESAPRNARVIVQEADGICRLVRYIRTVSANEREMSVQLLDAPGLQKPVTVKAQIIARLIGMRTPDY